MKKEQRIHPLDKLISDDSIFLLEALVAFVDYPYKKPLVMYIKYREYMSIANALNDIVYVEKCGFNCHPQSSEDMIRAIGSFMPGDFAATIEQAKKMQSMMSMMDTFNKFNADSDNSGATAPASDSDSESDSEDLYESILNILDGE